MIGIYIIGSKNKELNSKIFSQILEKYSNKKIGIFYPIINENEIKDTQALMQKLNIQQDLDQAYAFELTKAIEQFKNDEFIFFNTILDKYETLKNKYDIVFIISFNEFDILDTLDLNVNLAKNLNTPIAMITQNNILAKKYLDQVLKNKNYALIDENSTLNELDSLKAYDFLTPYRFKYELIKKNIKNKKTIVLPESDDQRILQACEILIKNDLANIILLGDEEQIKKNANFDVSKIQILNPKNSIFNEEFATMLYEARKAKGMSLEQAKELIKDRTYFGTLLVHSQKADAMVSGASTTTAETIRPALQIIKTKEGISSVSGIFFMGLKDEVLAFADCAVNPNPTPQELAQSAYVSALSAKAFGLDPKIAFLSYSSGDSGKGVSVDLVKEAVKIAKEQYPNLAIEGPIQFDAAYDLSTAKSKMPHSKIAGYANVFIFPDLNAANICYKAVQRTANALAIGPLLQGLKKPVNDLSRGCLVDDIVDTVILSAVQAQ